MTIIWTHCYIGAVHMLILHVLLFYICVLFYYMYYSPGGIQPNACDIDDSENVGAVCKLYELGSTQHVSKITRFGCFMVHLVIKIKYCVKISCRFHAHRQYLYYLKKSERKFQSLFFNVGPKPATLARTPSSMSTYMIFHDFLINLPHI